MSEQPADGPRNWSDAAACVDAVLERLGPRIVVGTSPGLGKPVLTLNELYRRCAADPSLELTIITGLTLAAPEPGGELHRRLLAPIVERCFGGYPQPDWVEPRRLDRLPPNVRVIEFFMQPGALLNCAAAQRDYVSSNYTHVVRDAIDRGMNLYAQMVAARPGGSTLSLSCNSDLTLDAVDRMRRRRSDAVAVADVNERLPFMTGAAEVPASTFDHVIRAPGHDFPLFGPPDEAVTTTDWMVALHASALVRDGGMLQLGIGSLADGITHLLCLRHEDNARWRALLDQADVLGAFGDVIERIGGTGPFTVGLYAATEMFVNGYMAMFRAGVLKRRAWPWAPLQVLADAGRRRATPDRGMLETLLEAGAVSSPLRAEDVAAMVRTGVLRGGVRLEGDRLVLPGGAACAADLREPATLDALERGGLGDAYRGGKVLHAAFFLGPRSFYEQLSTLDDAERDLFEMTSIARVNDLHGDETLKRLQCRDGRFINTVITATLLGAAASDALADGRVISGVGGQYELVAKAHALEDGRSILLLRSTRVKAGRTHSNIVFSYGHTTIPRHLRDIVVTEYGIADLRGRTDAECSAAMIAVADSRFQPRLVAQARAAGKLPRGWTVPPRFRRNLPGPRHAMIDPLRASGVLPRFPIDGDLDEREGVLIRCLKATAQRAAAGRWRVPTPRMLAKLIAPPDAARPYLERMGLERPRGVRERMLRLGLLYSLITENALDGSRAAGKGTRT